MRIFADGWGFTLTLFVFIIFKIMRDKMLNIFLLMIVGNCDFLGDLMPKTCP